MNDPYPGKPRRLFLSCPLCMNQRPLVKKGTEATMRGKVLTKGVKGLQHLDRADLQTHEIIRVCACAGYGKGFPRLKGEGLTLEKLRDDTKFAWLKGELVKQCRAILAQLGESEDES